MELAPRRRRQPRSLKTAAPAALTGSHQLHIYVTEADEPDDKDLFTQLRCNFVQAVAVVQMLLQNWDKPGVSPGIQFSICRGRRSR